MRPPDHAGRRAGGKGAGYFRVAPHHLQVFELLVTEEPQLLQSVTFTGPGAGGGAGAGPDLDGGAAGPAAAFGGDSGTLVPHLSQNLTPSRRA